MFKGHQQRRFASYVQRGAALFAARKLGIGNWLYG